MPSRASGGAPTPDEVEAAYGLDALVQAPPASALPPPPEGVGETGGTKWPQAKAFAYLAACPKVGVYIPLTNDDRARYAPPPLIVTWNGWSIPVPKGAFWLVPAPIASIVENMLQAKRTEQARLARAIDMMLMAPDGSGGLLLAEYSDPVAVDLMRRGAPLRMG